MNNFLSNPVYYALVSGDAEKSFGSERVRYFHVEVSPFVGFEDNYDQGFDELYDLLPPGRKILFASQKKIGVPKDWELIQYVHGTQFIFSSQNKFSIDLLDLVKLELQHVDQMVALAALTRPGPFDKRTIEFGEYYGIFDEDKLVAMTGQRLHVYDYTEISAVCTHPDYLGRGYAASLIKHQVNVILNSNKVPFLHVRSDNERAVTLYERLGFEKNSPMHFYFMSRLD